MDWTEGGKRGDLGWTEARQGSEGRATWIQRIIADYWKSPEGSRPAAHQRNLWGFAEFPSTRPVHCSPDSEHGFSPWFRTLVW